MTCCSAAPSCSCLSSFKILTDKQCRTTNKLIRDLSSTAQLVGMAYLMISFASQKPDNTGKIVVSVTNAALAFVSGFLTSKLINEEIKRNIQEMEEREGNQQENGCCPPSKETMIKATNITLGTVAALFFAASAAQSQIEKHWDWMSKTKAAIFYICGMACMRAIKFIGNRYADNLRSDLTAKIEECKAILEELGKEEGVEGNHQKFSNALARVDRASEADVNQENNKLHESSSPKPQVTEEVLSTQDVNLHITSTAKKNGKGPEKSTDILTTINKEGPRNAELDEYKKELDEVQPFRLSATSDQSEKRKSIRETRETLEEWRDYLDNKKLKENRNSIEEGALDLIVEGSQKIFQWSRNRLSGVPHSVNRNSTMYGV